jgi:hypothetical protein
LGSAAVIDGDPNLLVPGPLAVAGVRSDPGQPPRKVWRDDPLGLRVVPRLLIDGTTRYQHPTLHNDILTVSGSVLAPAPG